MTLKQDNSSGYTALRDGAGLVARGESGRIVLAGADRRAYLQGLLTNDIEALTPGTGCYAAMLTAQGRMITDMRVLELGDAIVLDVPIELVTAVRDHFDRFIFSEDVRVEDVTAARGEIGLYGPEAVPVLQRAPTEGSAPDVLYGSSRVRIAGIDALLVRSDTVGIEGFDIMADAGEIEGIRAALLAAGAVAATADDAETLRIENGHPRFGLDMDTDTIPLEAGIEGRALSRTKGCYVGQEVIVRVQDRGHGRVARRLVGLTFDASAAVPGRGAPVMAAEKEAGRVTSAVFSPALARPIALAYIHRDLVAAGTPLSVPGCGDAIVSLLPFVPR